MGAAPTNERSRVSVSSSISCYYLASDYYSTTNFQFLKPPIYLKRDAIELEFASATKGGGGGGGGRKPLG
jgi:hypothetical protein